MLIQSPVNDAVWLRSEKLHMKCLVKLKLTQGAINAARYCETLNK